MKKAIEKRENLNAKLKVYTETLKDKSTRPAHNECLLALMFDVNDEQNCPLTHREIVSNAFGMGVGGNDSTAR